jgi:hypothetical protein
MAGEMQPPESLDGVLDLVRRKVADRRAAGEYPADLEERLGGHFDRIRLLRAEEDRLEPVRVALADLERHTHFSLAHNTSSRNPLGERYHRLMDEAISRQVEPLVGQVRAYVDQLREVFGALVDRLDDPGSHVHADLLGQIDAALDRLGQLHSMPADPAPRVTTEASPPVGSGATAWVGAAELATFRFGTAAEVEERFRTLIPQLDPPAGPALGVDVGRGELVALLGRSGLEVEGWERQRALATQATGVTLHIGDGLDALAAAPEASLGFVVLPDPGDLLRLADTVAISATRLRPDGRLLVTGVDPDGAGPFPRRLRADPGRLDSIYPETVELLCRSAGLRRVSRWRSDDGAWTPMGTAKYGAELFAVSAGR